MSGLGELISVNVCEPGPLRVADEVVSSGIDKRPVSGSIRLGRSNLEGDGQADLVNHGGPDKAVYLYSADDIEYWSRELERTDLGPGFFGENFTVSGLSDADVCLGDVCRVGAALIEVSQPRVPCSKLAARLADPRFPKRFLRSLRTGFYARVLEEGEVRAGDAIERVRRDPSGPQIAELVRKRFFERDDRAFLEQVLGVAALSQAWRREIEEIVAGG